MKVWKKCERRETFSDSRFWEDREARRDLPELGGGERFAALLPVEDLAHVRRVEARLPDAAVVAVQREHAEVHEDHLSAAQSVQFGAVYANVCISSTPQDCGKIRRSVSIHPRYSPEKSRGGTRRSPLLRKLPFRAIFPGLSASALEFAAIGVGGKPSGFEPPTLHLKKQP